MDNGFELYCHPLQKKKKPVQISGYEMKEHLEKTGLIDRVCSLEDETVRLWIANNATYPLEFRHLEIYLWGSQRRRSISHHEGYIDEVCHLIWGGCHNSELFVEWRYLNGGLIYFAYTLLKSSR